MPRQRPQRSLAPRLVPRPLVDLEHRQLRPQADLELQWRQRLQLSLAPRRRLVLVPRPRAVSDPNRALDDSRSFSFHFQGEICSNTQYTQSDFLESFTTVQYCTLIKGTVYTTVIY